MKSSKIAAIIVGLVISAGYAAWMTYWQWHWYLGWPDLAWAQGITEWGWPSTFLCVYSYQPERWFVQNLCINSVFCLSLSIGLGFVMHGILHSLMSSRLRPQFSLSTLLLTMLAVGSTFALWQAMPYIFSLAVGREDFPYMQFEIPRQLTVLVSLGFFCFAYSVASGIGTAVARSFRRRNVFAPAQQPAQVDAAR